MEYIDKLGIDELNTVWENKVMQHHFDCCDMYLPWELVYSDLL